MKPACVLDVAMGSQSVTFVLRVLSLGRILGSKPEVYFK